MYTLLVNTFVNFSSSRVQSCQKIYQINVSGMLLFVHQLLQNSDFKHKQKVAGFYLFF